jgi:hypothetical protein
MTSKTFLFLKLTTAILMAVLGVGCASMNWNEYRQTVLVTSLPAGAEIYSNGQLLGTTPAYVRIRRAKNPKIELRHRDQNVSVPLATHYRWKGSFVRNLIFFYYAPAGWLVDYTTGTAWEIEDPQTARFAKADRPVAKTLSTIAVAPPVASDTEMTDALGVQIQDKMARNNSYLLLDYNKTALEFIEQGSEQGVSKNKSQRYDLFFKLKADSILWSEVRREDDRVKVSAELKDVYTGTVREKFDWDLAPADKSDRRLFAHRKFFEYFKLLPNTLFLNFMGYTPEIRVGEQTYTGREGAPEGPQEEAFRYLSTISLERQDRPRYGLGGYWTFEFLPTFTYSMKKIEFSQFAPGTEFKRTYASTGYGFEVAYRSRYGNVYYDFMPVFSWSQIQYESSRGEGTVAKFRVGTYNELGYSYFLTKHLVGKVFTRTIAEDNSLWDRAISRSSGREVTTDTVSSGFFGVAIGYHYPPPITQKNYWRFSK